jgi:hypothetical protein
MAKLVFGKVALGAFVLLLLFGGAAAAVSARQTPPAGGTLAAAKAHPAKAAHVVRAEIAVMAQTIGITEDELKTALRGGQTVAQVAQAHNVGPQTVIDAVVNDVLAKAQARPGWARLTDAQKANFTDRLRERVTRFVNEGPRPGKQARPGKVARAVKAEFEVAARTIGVTPQELRAAIKGGQTVAQVAQAHNVGAQTVIDAVVNDALAKLQSRPGWARLTDAQKARVTDRLRQGVTNWVNGAGPVKGRAKP